MGSIDRIWFHYRWQTLSSVSCLFQYILFALSTAYWSGNVWRERSIGIFL